MIKQFKFKRRIKKLLAELDLSHSFNAALLCRRLRKKGYQISLCPTQMPPGLESAYILCEKTHVICVTESASPFRQQCLIFHELGHILLEHRNLNTEDLLWGGTLYSRWEEREAEIFASLLMEASLKRISGFEHFQQVLFPHKKSKEETESLQKIAAFFQRFDAHRPV